MLMFEKKSHIFLKRLAMPNITWSFDSAVRGYHFYRKYWTPNLSQRLDCYHEPNNAFDQFAIKMIMMEKKNSENCWAFTPRNLKAYEISVSNGSSHTCRNILSKV